MRAIQGFSSALVFMVCASAADAYVRLLEPVEPPPITQQQSKLLTPLFKDHQHLGGQIIALKGRDTKRFSANYIDIGRLAGVARGDVFAVYTPAGKPVGLIRVLEAQRYTSTFEFLEMRVPASEQMIVKKLPFGLRNQLHPSLRVEPVLAKAAVVKKQKVRAPAPPAFPEAPKAEAPAVPELPPLPEGAAVLPPLPQVETPAGLPPLPSEAPALPIGEVEGGFPPPPGLEEGALPPLPEAGGLPPLPQEPSALDREVLPPLGREPEFPGEEVFAGGLEDGLPLPSDGDLGFAPGGDLGGLPPPPGGDIGALPPPPGEDLGFAPGGDLGGLPPPPGEDIGALPPPPGGDFGFAPEDDLENLFPPPIGDLGLAPVAENTTVPSTIQRVQLPPLPSSDGTADAQAPGADLPLFPGG